MPAKGQLTGIYIKCENCGKEVYKTKSQYKKAIHHFCSNKCQKIFQHALTYEIRKCEICNKEFEVSKKSTQRFCSTECQNKWQTTIIGKLNPRTNRIKCNCDYCGKGISIIPSNYKRFQNHFCSDDCRMKWYATDYSQRPEWKEESRIRAVNILNKGIISTTNTKPQIIINNVLDNMKISYINEKSFDYYSADNYLNDYNLIIEIMGDFWHGSPLKYQLNNLYDVQIKNIRRDKSKKKYILQKYNITILYLWENDIYNNIDVCIELIKLYISNKGILNNYHSFNYEYDCILKIKDNIIMPFQDMDIAA